MKVKFALAAAILALLVPAMAQAAPGPKATGGGRAASAAEFGFAFTAQGTPDAAKGMVNYRRDAQGATAALSYKGTVLCYTQSGSTASFSGVITQADGTTNGFFIWNVIDRGEGGSEATPGDALRARTGAQEFDCTAANTAFPGIVYAGNIQVHRTE